MIKFLFCLISFVAYSIQLHHIYFFDIYIYPLMISWRYMICLGHFYHSSSSFTLCLPFFLSLTFCQQVPFLLSWHPLYIYDLLFSCRVPCLNTGMRLFTRDLLEATQLKRNNSGSSLPAAINCHKLLSKRLGLLSLSLGNDGVLTSLILFTGKQFKPLRSFPLTISGICIIYFDQIQLCYFFPYWTIQLSN